MNAETMTLTVPYHEARERYSAYERLAKDGKATGTDRALYRAYRSVLNGGRVLDIIGSMQTAGLNAQQLPKLAICRADAATCHFFLKNDHWWFSTKFLWAYSKERAPRGTVKLPRRSLLQASHDGGQAKVPFIPPHCRPKHALHNYHVLWEAEWDTKPPSDPFLLKHLDGPFYVVVAMWNLTALEQAVMRGL